MHRRALGTHLSLAACASLIATSALQAQELAEPVESITRAELRDHIHYLASDFLEGRKTGEPGYMRAAQYGAIHFAAAGLEPMFADSSGTPSYFQDIAFNSTQVSPVSDLQVTVRGEARRYRLGEEFVTLQVSSGLELSIEEAPIFLGYGIDEAEYGWNDYEDLDVAGKIAVIVGGAPMRDGEPVLPEQQHNVYRSLSRSANARVLSAMNHGVAALFVVIDSESTSLWEEVAGRMSQRSLQPAPRSTSEDSGASSFPWIVLIRARDAADMLSGTGYDPVSRTGTYTPGPLDGVSIALELRYDSEPAPPAPNVVALLPGTDPVLKDEYVVISAHLDHLGVRNGQVYNGADDNASGSAAVLEAAEAAAMAPVKRSIIFVLFTGEEEGLLGSTYFADNPPVPVESIALIINLDMVGRNSPDWPESLLVLASENRRGELLEVLRRVNARVGANLDWRLNEGQDPYSHVQRSDQLAFLQKGVPAMLITRGFMGPDYHTPTDVPGTINYEKVVQAARLAYALAAEVGNMDEPLK